MKWKNVFIYVAEFEPQRMILWFVFHVPWFRFWINFLYIVVFLIKKNKIFPFVAHMVPLFCLVTIIFREILYVSVFLDCHINWTNTNLFILVHTPTNTICFLNYFRYSGHLSIPICETCISMSSLLLDSTVLRQWQQHTASHFMSHKCRILIYK